MLPLYGLVFFFLNIFFTQIFSEVGKAYYLGYTFLEYATFTYLLWGQIQNKRFKKAILYLSFGFVLFQMIYFLYAPNNKVLDSAPIGVESILVLVYVFYFFYEQLRNITATNIYNLPVFWYACGILIYLSGTFFFYILANHLSPTEILPHWYVTYIFDILKNLLLTIGILVSISKLKSTPTLSKNIPYLDLN